MSSFLSKVFDKEEIPTDVTVNEEITAEDPTSTTTDPEGTPSEESTVDTTETPAEDTTTETPAEDTSTEEPKQTEKKKVVVDINEYLQTHQEAVLKVLKEKSTDYEAMSNEDALRIKLAKDNPSWDKADIEAELEDQYGVGQDKITIDKDSMDADDVKDAEAHNRKIDAAARLLKKEAKLAKEELASATKDLVLPEFEYEVEAELPQDVDVVLQEKIKEYNDGLEEVRQEVWIPALKEAIKPLDKLSEKVSYTVGEGDKASTIELDVDLTLTPEDKQLILEQLSAHQASADDEQYMDGDNVDYGRFVKEKSEVIVRKKIYAQIAKAAADKAVNDYIRGNVVNYSSGVRNTATSDNDNTDIAVGIWKNRKK